MSVACGVECVVVLGCVRWVWKRCTYIGSYDSESWAIATAEEFEGIPRVCRLILAVYEPDLRCPKYAPAGGYRLNPDWVVKRVTYEQTQGHAPPYLIYADHDNREIVVAIRGMNLLSESDYKLLLDNKLGKQMFDGGYVHHGLLKSATWVLNAESETLRRLWEESGKSYKMVFAGHSLGSGVAALLSVIVVNHGDRLGGIPRSLVKCYAVAPARCMSLNLAVKYADVINSVILQDDFLPRTPTPLEDIFKSIFCLPCLLFLVCLRDTFIPEGRKLRDQRRLYAPGRIYHIVERKFCSHTLAIVRKKLDYFYATEIAAWHRCGRYPPEVRTAIPVDGRFEHIVLSCNATSDHAIIWIEREAEKGLETLREIGAETVTTPPKVQKLDRKLTLEKEHKDALERAVSLNIPHAVTSAEEEEEEEEEAIVEERSSAGKEPSKEETDPDAQKDQSFCKNARTNWNEVIEKLFNRNESGKLLLKRDDSATESGSGSTADR